MGNSFRLDEYADNYIRKHILRITVITPNKDTTADDIFLDLCDELKESFNKYLLHDVSKFGDNTGFYFLKNRDLLNYGQVTYLPNDKAAQQIFGKCPLIYAIEEIYKEKYGESLDLYIEMFDDTHNNYSANSRVAITVDGILELLYNYKEQEKAYIEKCEKNAKAKAELENIRFKRDFCKFAMQL